ncbi:MAG: preprotein translocase subunit SecG [bacterium]|nr:preprotein translocase subunit SecG [bacterium]
MHTILTVIQIASAVLLTIVILLQQRGTGLGSTFGGGGAVYRTKRGVEKFLFWGTIVLSFIFFGSILITIIWRF